MSNEPTMGELLRRMDEQTKDTERVVQRLDSLVEKLEQSYVPRREFDLRMAPIEEDRKNQGAFRRQVIGGFLVGALLIVLGIVLALSGAPGGAA